jgi:hypothetical protein
MSSNKDSLTKEIDSWRGFGYALRKENRIIFEEMLSNCKVKGYIDCVNTRGENFSTEALFLILILEQQTMISKLIAKLHARDKRRTNIEHGSFFTAIQRTATSTVNSLMLM